jgi:hypothetical protein
MNQLRLSAPVPMDQSFSDYVIQTDSETSRINDGINIRANRPRVGLCILINEDGTETVINLTSVQLERFPLNNNEMNVTIRGVTVTGGNNSTQVRDPVIIPELEPTTRQIHIPDETA